MKLLAPPYGRLLMPVYVPTLLNSTSQMALMILLPLYALDAGYDAAFAATIVGLRGVGILLFDIPAGVLVARFGEKTILLTGLALILSGNALLAAETHPWLLMLAAVLVGAGISAWMIGRQSYIVDTCAPDEVGRAIAVMAGLQRAGMFVGPAAGGLVFWAVAPAQGSVKAMHHVYRLVALWAGRMVEQHNAFTHMALMAPAPVRLRMDDEDGSMMLAAEVDLPAGAPRGAR